MKSRREERWRVGGEGRVSDKQYQAGRTVVVVGRHLPLLLDLHVMPMCQAVVHELCKWHNSIPANSFIHCVVETYAVYS